MQIKSCGAWWITIAMTTEQWKLTRIWSPLWTGKKQKNNDKKTPLNTLLLKTQLLCHTQNIDMINKTILLVDPEHIFQ